MKTTCCSPTGGWLAAGSTSRYRSVSQEPQGVLVAGMHPKAARRRADRSLKRGGYRSLLRVRVWSASSRCACGVDRGEDLAQQTGVIGQIIAGRDMFKRDFPGRTLRCVIVCAESDTALKKWVCQKHDIAIEVVPRSGRTRLTWRSIGPARHRHSFSPSSSGAGCSTPQR